MLFQFLAAPKYCVFTYSAIEQDTLPLYILFGAHELLFIFHGWQFYGGIIYVSSCFGAELTQCIDTLTEVLVALMSSRGLPNRLRVSTNSRMTDPFGKDLILDESQVQQSQGYTRRMRKGFVKSLEDVMMEYRKLTIWSDRINDYGSYNFLVIHGLAYCQMVSDVFVMIQLLRMPETDVVSVVFFAEDAGVL